MTNKINNEVDASFHQIEDDFLSEVDFPISETDPLTLNENNLASTKFEKDEVDDSYQFNDDDDEDFLLSEEDFLFSEEDSLSLDENNLAAIKFEQECKTYSIYNPNYPAEIINHDLVKFSIPCSFLPLTQQVVYGLTCHPILLEITLELSQFDWKLEPQKLQMVHPIKGNNFIGSPLIHNIANSFFSPNYKPKEYYHAQSHLFSIQPVEPNQKLLSFLFINGFNYEQAKKALIFANNNINQAIQFLNTGNMYEEVQTPISNFFSFQDSPLIYFVLELTEAFFDLSHCCCICHKELSTPGVKPSICNSELCKFSLYEIGIGNSICEEINLDPEAADLMVSIYASSYDSIFCKPSYPKLMDKLNIEKILNELPPISELSKCQNDIELNAKIGTDAFELLKWILLSHLSFIVSLSESMKMSQFPSTRQFMTLISSPEAENKFCKLRKKYGSVFLWHGSEGNRWHSIIRNGLKVGSGTYLQRNGAIYGKGIYFADDSSVSWSYVRTSTNRYKNSMLGCNLDIIALCEVAKVPELINHTHCRTTVREEAVIVRYLIIGNRFSVNLASNPPKLPSKKEILESLIQKKKNI